jgi:predicted enzyme related to lactoylglutathione lyase
MGIVIRPTVIDCLDPDVVARFWGSVLGWEVQHEEKYLWMSESGVDDSVGLVLVFVSVSEVKNSKNRMHLDLGPKATDQATEVERLRGLGATTVDVGQGDQPWVVLADPEGNEFCVESHLLD